MPAGCIGVKIDVLIESRMFIFFPIEILFWNYYTWVVASIQKNVIIYWCIFYTLKSKKVVDIYLNKREIKIFVSSRHNTKNTHGTGCTLSSAITTFFSCGKSIKSACELGIKYVNSAILTNPKYGKGHGPINHLNSILLDKRFN